MMQYLKGSDTLREMYPKVNENFENIDDQLKTHEQNFEDIDDRLNAHEQNFGNIEENIQQIETNLQDISDSFNAHKDEYAAYKNSNNLEIAKIKKEIADYKAAMALLNPNHEAKQAVEGYGIVNLPPNCANGQVSASVKGHTITQILDYNPNTWEEWEITGLNTVENGALILKRTDTSTSASLNANFKPNTKYGFLVNVVYSQNVSGDKISCWDDAFADTSTSHARLGYFLSQVGNSKIIYISKPDIINNRIRIRTNTDNIEVRIRDLRIFELPSGSQIEQDFETLSADELAQKYPFVRGTKSTVCGFRIRSVSQDESQESVVYVLAKDDEGNTEELRSLPNGTKDEVRVSENKLIKRIGDKTNVASGTVINYADMADNGTYYAWNDDGETETGVKGDTLGIDATTLIYQLAQEQVIPVQVSGTLVGFPSGTVYWEQIVPDAGVYTDKMEVLHKDLPIKSIEKLSKVDFTTGVEYELDPSQAVVSANRLSFTHPELQEGDITFFIYAYEKESTTPEMTIQYYDSRYVVKDAVTGKFYKWELVVANGQWDIALEEV